MSKIAIESYGVSRKKYLNPVDLNLFSLVLFRESQKVAAECFASEASEDVDDLPSDFLDKLNIDEVTNIRMRLSNPDIQPEKMNMLKMRNLKLLTKKSQR